jgi:hypothetical protein
MFNTIVRVDTVLRNLGASVPSGVWNDIRRQKEGDFFKHLVMTDKDGVDYINESTVSLLKSVYQRLYEEPNYPTTENLAKLKVELPPQYKYVIEGKGFNTSKEIYNHLSGMLKAYTKGTSLNTVDRAFLSYLLCRSPLIQKDVANYGVVVDLMVDIKEGNKSKTFHIIYLNGRKQHISMKNYTDPGTEVLVDLWGKNVKNI